MTADDAIESAVKWAVRALRDGESRVFVATVLELQVEKAGA